MAEFLQQCGSWGVLATLAAYAAALSRIFERPVKETLLYFFDCDAAVHPE